MSPGARTSLTLRITASESPPAPDLVVQSLPEHGGFVVAPCHRGAADWLDVAARADAIWAGEALTAGDPGEIVSGAARAGLAVAFAFHGGPRVLGGLVAVTQDH